MKAHSLLITSVLTLFALAACAAPAAAETASLPPLPTGALQASPTAAPPSPPPVDLSRTDEQGAVAVTVLPESLDGPEGTLRFRIAMDTHSVNLDMDLTKLATLETDTGISVTPVAWDGSRGGHHVSGVLSFSAVIDEKPILEGASLLTLTIREVDTLERVFVWDLGS